MGALESPDELAPLDALLSAASGTRWLPGCDDEGLPVVRVEFDDRRDMVMRVTREADPAAPADVRFVAHARVDLDRLIASLRGDAPIDDDELARIAARAREASPEPWLAFVEADGGIGGSNVMWVTGRDEEPDLYLWLGTDVAPGPDFQLVAKARSEIPRLVQRIRQRGRQ